MPSLEVYARGGALELTGAFGQTQLLNNVTLQADAGDVKVQGVLALGAVRGESAVGQLRAVNVVGSSIALNATALQVEDLEALEVCVCGLKIAWGTGCKAMNQGALGMGCGDLTVNQTRIAAALTKVSLTSYGGPILVNGTMAAAAFSVAAPGGTPLAAVADGVFLGTLGLEMGPGDGGGAGGVAAVSGGGGAAHLSNVVVLGCSACLQVMGCRCHCHCHCHSTTTSTSPPPPPLPAAVVAPVGQLDGHHG